MNVVRSLFMRLKPSPRCWLAFGIAFATLSLLLFRRVTGNYGLPPGCYWVGAPVSLKEFMEKEKLNPDHYSGAIVCEGGLDFKGGFNDYKWTDAAGKWVRSPVGSYDRFKIKWDKAGWSMAQKEKFQGLVILWPLGSRSRPALPDGHSDYHGVSWAAPQPVTGEWAVIDEKYGVKYGLVHNESEDGPYDSTRLIVAAHDAKGWSEAVCARLAEIYGSDVPWPENFTVDWRWKKDPLGFRITKPAWGIQKGPPLKIRFSATQQHSSERIIIFTVNEDNKSVKVWLGDEP